MSTNRLPALIAVSCLTLTALLGATEQKRTTWNEQPTYPPPASLRELWTDAQLVILGQVDTSRQRAEEMPAGLMPHPFIEHDVRILELLKPNEDNLKTNSVIHVIQSGGQVSTPDGETTSPSENFPIFEKGQWLVLFLSRQKGAGDKYDKETFQTIGGLWGAFPVDKGRTRIELRKAKGYSHGIAQFADKDSEDLTTFLQLIRKMRGSL